MLISLDDNNWHSICSNESKLSHLVAASDKFLKVQRQFWTRRVDWCPRFIARACIPPASTTAGLFEEQTDKTLRTLDVVQSNFS